MKIAITGGIGSGKSYVCRLLTTRGISIYDCDSAAKRLMRTSPIIRQQLCQLIGPKAYHADGLLNKAEVANFLMASEENKQAINAIVHPAVAEDFLQSGMQWMECAILYESGFDHLVDSVIVVTAPLNVRLERIMQRDHISRESALAWINKILAIAGKPGLYKLVSRGKNNLIVEALDATHRRQPAFGSDRITSLADIAMFTDTDDVPLMDVLESLKTLENGKKSSVDYKKADGDELREYFAKVLPNFDRDRVHSSDIKKLIQWYNILIENGISDFKEEMKPTEGDNIDDRKDAE